MLYLDFTQVMEAVCPVPNLAEHVSPGAGNQNKSPISAVHHSSCNIDSAARDVSVAMDFCNTIDGSGVLLPFAD
jgi:hypothetical protein